MYWRALSVYVLERVSMKRSASAVWFGGARGGRGLVTTGSGALSQTKYPGPARGKGNGTNPYELIAGGHATSYSLTLANELAAAGFKPHRIVTTTTIIMERLSAGWNIAGIQLDVLAEVPQAKQGDFIRAAVSAKTRCAISRLLNANISMSAKLETSGSHVAEESRPQVNSLKASKTKKQSIGRLTPEA
jgi:lipoyl-dependent peroxiredoxin